MCAAILFVIGVVNLFPSVVALMPERTSGLYGVAIEGNSLSILLRHRAVLLGLLGAALIYSAFKPDVRVAAIVGALASKITFVLLLLVVGNFTQEIKGVATIDTFAIVGLLIALALHLKNNEQKRRKLLSLSQEILEK